MAIIYFDSADIYINQGVNVDDKIVRLNAIITALEDAILKGAATGNLSEYSLDDGQTKIRTVYRSLTEATNALTALETIRQRWINQKNGRHMRFMDGKNFRRYGYR